MRLFYLPALEFFLCLVLGVAIPLLKSADELTLFAFDDIQVIIGEFSLLLFHFPYYQFPAI